MSRLLPTESTTPDIAESAHSAPRALHPSARHRPPPQLTSFVGRDAEIAELSGLADGTRLLTVIGAGGIGKTRIAVELAVRLAAGYPDGVAWAQLASLRTPELVPVTVARALGLPDQPGRSTVATMTRVLGSGRTLLVLDNCEHLRQGCAALAEALLTACPRLTILATSREPLGATGETTWLTPPLSTGEAIELFTGRARLARPDFELSEQNRGAVDRICRRLDGVPLAIELAAARVRALSTDDIADGLGDRFQLLTGGSPTALPRHQTLRASTDWSYALLTQAAQLVFRRLAVFAGGFDLDAAHAVAGDPDQPRRRLIDELSELIDKSMVVRDGYETSHRYRLLETMRDYATEKLAESAEADLIHRRHRDHYARLAAAGPTAGRAGWLTWSASELDNLRAAYVWSRDSGDTDVALGLASALQPRWLRGRVVEGLAWFDDVLAGGAVASPVVRARALADKLMLNHLSGTLYRLDEADEALAIARTGDDPGLLARALTAAGLTSCYFPERALPLFAEALTVARNAGDDELASQILGWQAYSAYIAGDFALTRAAASEGHRRAEAVGDGLVSRLCRWCLGLVQWVSGDLEAAAAQATEVTEEARAEHDLMFEACGLMLLAVALAHAGDADTAHSVALTAADAAADLPGFQRGAALGAVTEALLARGETASASAAGEQAWEACPLPELLATNGNPVARAALAAGDVTTARRSLDDALAVARGGHRITLLAARVRVALAAGDVGLAGRDAVVALGIALEIG
ncbi:ATP-binding protein, partial [Mycolicibacillus trivialis]